MTQNCFLQAELGHLPPANPPAIVFICPAQSLELLLSREGLRRDCPSFRVASSSGIPYDYGVYDFTDVVP